MKRDKVIEKGQSYWNGTLETRKCLVFIKGTSGLVA